MVTFRNKHWRQLVKRKKYISRLKTVASQVDAWIINGETIRNPKWIDVYNKKGTFHYKNTSTPCSCEMCSGEHYKRYKEKVNIQKELLQYNN